MAPSTCFWAQAVGKAGAQGVKPGAAAGDQGSPQPRPYHHFQLDPGHKVLAGPVYPVPFPHISPSPDPGRGSQSSTPSSSARGLSPASAQLGARAPPHDNTTDTVLRSWGQKESCFHSQTGAPTPALLFTLVSFPWFPQLEDGNNDTQTAVRVS